MKTVLCLFPVGLLLLDCALARDLLPERWIENIPAGDDSVQQCFVFQTKPGVIYRVETSNDLANWTPGEEVYGLGNEFVTTMREFSPPPVTTGGGGVPPAGYVPVTVATLRMRRSSSPGGGMIFSWRSLDDGGPVNAVLAQTGSVEWDRMPFYFRRFGSYDFIFLCDVRFPVVAPDVNPPFGPKDAAMFAQLETSFPAMDQEVVASVERSRHAPPPAPPDPNGKKFWRVHCDWGVDTDGDGSPDWMEFEMAASGNGALVTGVAADSFNADSNGDGIADGDQLDFDGDGVADGKDAGKEDSTAAFEIGPVPRYALFPITNAQPFENARRPVQMNDQGIVLYQNGTWAGGVWTPLAGSADRGDISVQVRAAGMNDHGEIIGSHSGMLDSEGNEVPSGTMLGNLVWWPDRNATAAQLTVDGGHPWIGSLAAGHPFPHRGTLLCNDGKFIACNETAPATDEDGNYIMRDTGEKCLWTLPGTGRAAGKAPSPYAEGGILDAYHFWGNLQDGTRALTSNGMLLSLETGLDCLHIGPREEFIGVQSFSGNVQVYWNGGWSQSELLTQAVDISKEGTVIGMTRDGKAAPILLNGRWEEISHCAPGLPEPWKSSSRHLDTTPGGWILSANGDPADAETQYGVMLPIKLEPAGAPVTALSKWDGVDGISTGAENVPAPVSQSQWIMVPLGGGETECVLKAPLGSISTLNLSGSHLRFNGQQEAPLSGAENALTVSAEAGYTPASGTEAEVDLKLGSVLSTSAPLKVKFMKRRTVKVNLYHVNLGTSGPDFSLLHTEIQNFLNNVYSAKINVDFAVQPAVVLSGTWDADGDGVMDALPENDIHAEQSNILGQRPVNAPVSNIDLFLMSGGQFKVSDGTRELPAWGVTNRAQRCIWIHAGLVADPANPGPQNTWRTNGDVGQTLSHEIGHIFTQYGHPDEEDGTSPLKGTDRSLRLMHSGEKTRGGRLGTLLVKEEWDAAEVWLRSEEANKRL